MKTQGNPGRLVVISGASASGKDTILKAWMANDLRIKKVITCTTRPRHEDEEEGVNYFFKTIDEFMAMIDNGELLEHASVHGHYYGVPKAEVQRLVKEGHIVALIVDVQGAISIFKQIPEARDHSVFLKAPNRAELERRLRDRKRGESEEAIQTRLANSEHENSEYYTQHYAHILVNDDVDRCVAVLKAIV
jgi:guanylate kinase